MPFFSARNSLAGNDIILAGTNPNAPTRRRPIPNGSRGYVFWSKERTNHPGKFKCLKNRMERSQDEVLGAFGGPRTRHSYISLRVNNSSQDIPQDLPTVWPQRITLSASPAPVKRVTRGRGVVGGDKYVTNSTNK